MPCGLREFVPPVWCGAIRTVAPSNAVIRTFSTRLLSQQISTPARNPHGVSNTVYDDPLAISSCSNACSFRCT